MQWWNDLITWANSDDGWRIITGAVIPFVAIVVAGFIAAGSARKGATRAIAQQNGERAAASVAAMIHAGRSATRWSALSGALRERAEAEFIAADVQLRLLPLNGSSAAADWATHELGSMRRDSASFSFQAEQTYVEFRDRLLEWQSHPNRARKLFALDLERFGLEDQSVDAELVEQQRRWAAEEAAAAAGATSVTPVAAEEPAPVRAVPYTATAIAREAVAEPTPAVPEPDPVAAPAAPDADSVPAMARSNDAEPPEVPELVTPPAPEPAAATSTWSLPTEHSTPDSPAIPESPETPESPVTPESPETPVASTPLVVSTPHTDESGEPAPLVEPETTSTAAESSTGPVERRPVEAYGE